MACKEFAGKVVVVTGACSGIGAQTALDFIKAGACVAMASNKKSNLEEFGRLCLKGGREPLLLHADVACHDQNVCLVRKTIELYKRIDVLVNNAGIFFQDSAENVKIKSFDKLSNVNVKGVMDLTLICAPHLIKTKGNIVNISSVCGLLGFKNTLSYCMSKAAVNQITRCTAIDLAPKGVRVNSVNPGVTETKLFEAGGFSTKDVKELYEKEAKTHPLGRVGKVVDISKAIMFLASDEHAKWITGLHLTVDGGWHNVCPW